MTEPTWSAVLDLVARCEEHGASSGLLNFGAPTSHGGVFIEEGRVCWAAATGLGRRLSDLLAQHASLRGIDLDPLHAQCVAEGKTLGRALLEGGMIEPEELESALRQHSAESVVQLCRSDDAPTWIPRLGPGYAPRLTFRPIELLCDVVAIFRPRDNVIAQQHLAQVAGNDGRAIAFATDLASPLLLPLATRGDVTVKDAVAIGRRSDALRRAAREFGDEMPLSFATNGNGVALAVTQQEGVVYAVWCENQAAMAAVTARHLQCIEAMG